MIPFTQDLSSFYATIYGGLIIGLLFDINRAFKSNFKILKYVLWIPTLFCLKKIGPGELIFMIIEIIINKGLNSINPNNDKIKSKILFIKFLYILKPHKCLYIINQKKINVYKKKCN